MSRIVSEAIFTPDDLLRMPDAVNYELVDGHLVERNMGMRSSLVAANIVALLKEHAQARNAGHVFGADASYRCYADAPDKIRKPDASFVAIQRFPGGTVPEGHSSIAPDLAVEVLSPNDLAYDVTEKVEEYLGAGVRLVWVVDPNSRIVQIYRPRGNPAGRLSGVVAGEIITGEDVLPGFSCAVADFFETAKS